MKGHFAYIRVSTVKQGERGSSLQEQRAAIEAYASRQDLSIIDWFVETETAAKRGRPVFGKMLKALDRGAAVGVVIHKIDRSARNLKDWADLGELVDRGIEIHFAYESVDLTSTNGRLAADIQACVAAAYIRNLRDEVVKGLYGRLKQGLYPWRAPIGYLDQGGGRPKTIDPVRGPLIAEGFALYATGNWSLESLGEELWKRGLRNPAGARVSHNGLSTILNNPFYMGLIRIKKNAEVFQGVHEPIADPVIFKRVQAILKGHHTHKANINLFRYQRLIRCASCGHSLTAERQKGHVYYRCHSKECPTTSLREEAIDIELQGLSAVFRFGDELWADVEADVGAILEDQKPQLDAQRQSISLAIGSCDERLTRLTDAYIDHMVEKDIYLTKKHELLEQRAMLRSKRAELTGDHDADRKKIEETFELIKSLGRMPNLENDEELRNVLTEATSNLYASGKNLEFDWKKPFQELVAAQCIPSGEPARGKLRTDEARGKVLTNFITKNYIRPLPPYKDGERMAA